MFDGEGNFILRRSPVGVKNDGREIILKDVRCAFVNVHRTTQFQGEGDPYYGINLLIEPGSENDKLVQGAIVKAAEAKWEKKAQAILGTLRGQSQKFCYIDGNTKEYTGFENKMALSAKRQASAGPPKLIDRDMSELDEMSGKPYGGCFVNAKVQLWAQDSTKWGKGIRCTLITVQFVRDGEAFGGTAPADAEGMEAVETPADDDVNS